MQMLLFDSQDLAPGVLDIPRGEESECPLRPPLKWAGGKRWIAPHIAPIVAAHRDKRLVEPFCGGLAVTLTSMPREALANDINPHLMNFYGWLKRGLAIDFPMENDSDMYYRYRERFNELIKRGESDSREAAGIFYYLNRTGYNGLCRFNKKGFFNVPFGRYKSINYTRDFDLYRNGFAKWQFTCTDFEDLEISANDIIYADPPYDVEFTSYSTDGFTWDDQVRTAEWLARQTVPVILSNQATDRIFELYEELGFSLQYLAAPRMISCTGDRSHAREVLALKNT